MLPNDTPSLDRTSRWDWLRPLAATLLAGVILAPFVWSLLGDWLAPPAGQAAAFITPTATAFEPPPTEAEASPATHQLVASYDGFTLLSLSEFGYLQLFANTLGSAQYTRLTYGAWDDVSPAISPDGARAAFASNRGGNWDLYLLDFASGLTTQFSHDPAYDGAPSWSAQGWLAYEHDFDGNLEIAIRPADGSLDLVNVSASPARDHSPAWRPGAQQIAFISDRGGAPAVWLVDLEQDGAGRFVQLAPDRGAQAAPAWSPDGSQLAWAERDDAGMWSIYVSDLGTAPRRIGSGEQPRWNPAGDLILAQLNTEGASYLVAYMLDGSLALAPQQLPGRLSGAAWAANALPDPLPGALLAASLAQPSADWTAALEPAAQAAAHETVALNGVYAPDPQLSTAAAAPFEALRTRTAGLLGWDALSSLEHAYVRLGTPLPPTRQDAWLYTGRAFALRSGLLSAGWLAAVREDINGQTYWRVYLRTANGAGGLGRPLTETPWDFSARYTGADSSYQGGGRPMSQVPAGYWLDFTALAADYGFERLPAQPNWRAFFPGALFNEFALRAGLSWEEAMLQLYTAEQLASAAP